METINIDIINHLLKGWDVLSSLPAKLGKHKISIHRQLIKLDDITCFKVEYTDGMVRLKIVNV